MDWIYLSPHFDDVALSAGGLVWEQAAAGGGVQVWTICGGDPPPDTLSGFAQLLHTRWGIDPQQPQAAVAQRREEDLRSCEKMGATCRHYSFPDCIYRRAPGSGAVLYPTEDALWAPIHPHEEPLIRQLSQVLARELPSGAGIVCPLGLGKHVDHRLTRAAAERLGRPLWYYADYPYSLQAAGTLERLRRAGWEATTFPLSGPALQAWQEAVECHRSQLSSFWPDLAGMREAIRLYCRQMGGVQLWRRPADPPR